MKRTLLYSAALLIAGCAPPPAKTPAPVPSSGPSFMDIQQRNREIQAQERAARAAERAADAAEDQARQQRLDSLTRPYGK